MMKIAVACDGKNVSVHFGHCQGFELFTVENGKVSGRQFYQNPGHKPGFLPDFLSKLGAKTVITGGIGGGATDIFKEKNIEVISGAEGDAGENVEKYLEGKLESSGSVCHEHTFESTCEEHSRH
ncbi:dinitrogenase iron-molybdenum cofactor [Caproiciproducens sp. NJN-50]|nr:dinitrogenase iron-molybdenum cofactor [Caproiciproducens sp. NJN-50]